MSPAAGCLLRILPSASFPVADIPSVRFLSADLPSANRDHVGGPVPSAALPRLRERLPAPMRAVVLPRGAVPGPADAPHAPPAPRLNAPAPAFYILQNGRGLKLWRKKPEPMHWPMPGLPPLRRRAKLLCHAPES